MNTFAAVCLVSLLASVSIAQQAGSMTAETHPPLTTYECTSSGCTSQALAVTMDANWRWVHNSQGTNCYSGNTWKTETGFCPDPDSCAKNCAVDGSDYRGTYGVTTTDSALTLGFVTNGPYSKNIGSRLYLMASETKYKMFKLVNKEFAFDVDVSQLPCGLNGALYFVEMDEQGNMGVGNNNAGAKFGTGYCDGQCPHDIKFISGQANIINWTQNPKDSNSGSGLYGACCGEMDIWEANSMSAAYTPHDCNVEGLYRCSGIKCGDTAKGQRYDGVCDKDGCDWNSYRMGDKDFYGTGKTVDTSKVFTVVTQFISSDGTDNGDLVEIRRFYKQNGKVIPNSYSKHSALSSYNSITDDLCTAQKTLFGDKDDFKNKGGLKAHGEMLKRGVVLVMSLWDDHDVNMLWLDSNYPLTASASTPGVARGPCDTSSGDPSTVENTYPNAKVIYSNVKVGALGTTTPGVDVSGSTIHVSSTTPVHSSTTPVHSSTTHSSTTPVHSSKAQQSSTTPTPPASSGTADDSSSSAVAVSLALAAASLAASL